jgi:hypothetical protein
MIDIVEQLRTLADACSLAARRCDDGDMADSIRSQHGLLLDAADMIVQLQERLVRQACHLEVIEAEVQRPRWPLLEDDDDPGMGL